MRNNPALNATLAALALILAVGGLTWVNYRFSVDNPGGNDYLARWMGANKWLVEGLSPYDPEVSLATQNAIYGHAAQPNQGEDVAHFVYPLHSMIFFGPLGLLDYTLSRAIWMTILEICLLLIVPLSLRLLDWRISPLFLGLLVLFSLVWYHGARTVIVGQFAGINALLIVIGLLLIKQEQDVGAGVVFALTTVKPQMVFLLIPFVLLWAYSVRRIQIIGGFFGAFLGMIAISLFLIPDWPFQMMGQILEYPSYTEIGSPLWIIANTAPALSATLNGVLHIVAFLYLLVEWVGAWGKGPRWFLWVAFLTIVITNLVAFRTATTNFVMMLPALLLIFQIWRQRWKQAGTVAVVITLLALFIGLWALFLQTVDGNIENPVMYLPLPFLCLVGLWWVRWWAVRPQRLLLENFAEQMG